jgi:hypothetical protein
MPSVSNAKYGAQSLSQLMQVLQQVAQRAGQVRDNYAPQQATATAPQTPFQGLMAGVIGEHNRRREEAKSQDDAAIQQSLALLDAIPDSPENTPKKLQLLTSILHPKTQKGWKEVWNPQADHTAQAQFLQQFTGMLPSDSGLSANEQQVRNQQITTGPGALLTQGVNQKYAEQNRGKFEFPDEDPYYAPQIIQTPDGKLKAIQYPKRGGAPLIHDIGEGQTEKQTVAGIRWQGKGSTTDPDAVARRATEAEAIKLAEADEHAWKSLSEDQKEIYRFKAGKSLVAKDALTAEAKKTGIEVAKTGAGLRVDAAAKKATELTPDQRSELSGEVEARVQQHFNLSGALEARQAEVLDQITKNVDPLIKDVVAGKLSAQEAVVKSLQAGKLMTAQQIDKEATKLRTIAERTGTAKYNKEIERWKGLYRKVLLQHKVNGVEVAAPGTVVPKQAVTSAAKNLGISEKDAYELMHNGFGWVVQGIDQP